MRSISSMAASPAAGSRFASGSSNSSTSTSSTRTPASDTRCFWPPDSSCGAWERCPCTSTSRADVSTRCFISSTGTSSFSRAKAMSSATVSPTNWASESCSTVPITLERVKMSLSRASLPPIVRLPVYSPSYENGASPLRHETSVDLPQPEGPAMRTFWPG